MMRDRVLALIEEHNDHQGQLAPGALADAILVLFGYPAGNLEEMARRAITQSPSKIAAIKQLRTWTNLSLRDAMDTINRYWTTTDG